MGPYSEMAYNGYVARAQDDDDAESEQGSPTAASSSFWEEEFQFFMARKLTVFVLFGLAGFLSQKCFAAYIQGAKAPPGKRTGLSAHSTAGAWICSTLQIMRLGLLPMFRSRLDSLMSH